MGSVLGPPIYGNLFTCALGSKPTSEGPGSSSLCSPDPLADPKSRSTLGLHNPHHRSIRDQNWGSTFWILPGVWEAATGGIPAKSTGELLVPTVVETKKMTLPRPCRAFQHCHCLRSQAGEYMCHMLHGIHYMYVVCYVMLEGGFIRKSQNSDGRQPRGHLLSRSSLPAHAFSYPEGQAYPAIPKYLDVVTAYNIYRLGASSKPTTKERGVVAPYFLLGW